MAPQVQEDVTFIYHFLPFSYILVAISDLIDPQSPNIPMPLQVQEYAIFAIFCYLLILEAIVELFRHVKPEYFQTYGWKTFSILGINFI